MVGRGGAASGGKRRRAAARTNSFQLQSKALYDRKVELLRRRSGRRERPVVPGSFAIGIKDAADIFIGADSIILGVRSLILSANQSLSLPLVSDSSDCQSRQSSGRSDSVLRGFLLWALQ